MTYTGWKTLEIILLVAAAVLFIAAAIVWRVLRVRQAHQALNGQDREHEIEILRSSRVGTWLDPVEDELRAETGVSSRPAERATREQSADEVKQPTKRTRTPKSAAGNRDRNPGAPTSLDSDAEIDDSSETELARTSLAKKRRKRAASNDDEVEDYTPTTLAGRDEEDDSTPTVLAGRGDEEDDDSPTELAGGDEDSAPTVLAKRGSKRSAAKKANDASDDDDAPTVLAGIRKHGVRQTVDADDDEDSTPTILWHSDAEDANVPQGAADNTDDSEDEAPTVLANGRKKKGGRR